MAWNRKQRCRWRPSRSALDQRLHESWRIPQNALADCLHRSLGIWPQAEQVSTKRDYSRQIEQPDSEVEKFLCKELRMVDDELYFVQKRLAELASGPRGPKKENVPRLWDLVVDLFY